MKKINKISPEKSGLNQQRKTPLIWLAEENSREAKL